MTSSLDAPVQTNAADPEQVKEAGDAQEQARLQDERDARADLEDYDKRRRAFDRIRPMWRYAPTHDTGLFELGRFCQQHNAALEEWERLRCHPELFRQMLMEGLARHVGNDRARRSKRK